ncbi:accessory Sec system protein Asp2 [Lactobacillus sp. ESL0703]|uniref:accessory Sec system protein Asp2 n=1 Tax=Lactobacillus sp. ESL0703 TaxID=2983218 RepID=UPI0023F85C46|nr:accessory Sec system protein Asp2 [Lactobacillus sp. ESL0703]MDF7668332.1 accessory Sec system protein Asp2 [Lactobacillus sp. ESL0703]
MKKAKRYLFHSGQQSYNLTDKFLTTFTYVWAEPFNLHKNDLEPIFDKSEFNEDYSDAFFLLDETSSWLTNYELLKQLPANQIIYSSQAKLSGKVQRLLDLRGAFKLDFGTDLSNLQFTLNHYFYGRGEGYRITLSEFVLQKQFMANAKLVGNNYYDLKVAATHGWTKLGELRHSVYLPLEMDEDIIIEFQQLGSVELKVEAVCFSLNQSKIIGRFSKSGKELHDGKLVIAGLKEATYFILQFYVRGEGNLHLGYIHIRRSLGKYGNIVLGAKTVNDDRHLSGDIAYLFNAGDLKPPLNVIFSGYHTAESFEGYRMMKNLQAPFLLISDLRYEGGGFYIGSDHFEQKVLAVIKSYLKKLNFTNQDLVLSGMSMGTYGAMYYGSQLNPGAIVIAKILLNIGTIAGNISIERPEDFRCASDLVLINEGANDKAAQKRMNDHMWRKLANSCFTNTTFALGYMENDDYDPNAFTELREFLVKRNPQVHLLSKGFPGRHNDDTPSIANWFVRQVGKTLKNKYQR